jgi:hypothetical protein
LRRIHTAYLILLAVLAIGNAWSREWLYACWFSLAIFYNLYPTVLSSWVFGIASIVLVVTALTRWIRKRRRCGGAAP